MVKAKKNKILKLLVGIVCIYLFVIIGIPLINKLPYMNAFNENTKKYDINTAAFFYTDQISDSLSVKVFTDL